MIKFIKKILLIISPFLVLAIIEASLPINFFTFRPWEALLYKSSEFPFYPNIEIQMQSAGDLTRNIKKNENWKTDKLGYRNNKFIKKPDIIIVGDSFIAGSSITQDSIIANQIMNLSNGQFSVYSIAPGSFDFFIRLLNQGVIKKPKILIFSRVERYIPNIVVHSKKNNINTNFNVVTLLKDKISRRYFTKFLLSKIYNKNINHEFDKSCSKMFFLNGDKDYLEDNYVSKVIKSLKYYDAYCKDNNMKFLFLPMPDKESVYYDFIPIKRQNENLLEIDSILQVNNIYSLNTLEIYNNYRRSSSSLLYHLDDSHWNANAINIVSKEILNYIEKNNLLY